MQQPNYNNHNVSQSQSMNMISSRPPLQCHYCKKFGHKQIDCFYFFKDSRKGPSQGYQGSMPQRGSFVRPLHFNKPSHHVMPRNMMHSQRIENNDQQQPCTGPCCVPSSPQELPPQQQQQQQIQNDKDNTQEFTEAVRYMCDMRDELGRESFKTFEPYTDIGKKVQKVLIDLENQEY